MEKYNIVLPDEYQAGTQTRTAWLKIGILIKNDDGKMSLKLNHMPGHWLRCFPQEERDQRSGNQGNGGSNYGSGGGREDMPF